MGQGILAPVGLSGAQAGLVIEGGVELRVPGDPLVQVRQRAGGYQQVKVLGKHEVQIRLGALQNLLRQPLAVGVGGDAADVLHLDAGVVRLKERNGVV